MSAENLQALRNHLSTTWFRHPYSTVHALAVELTRLADAELTSAELRAAQGALHVASHASNELLSLCNEHPATRAVEQREFIVAILSLIASAAGRKQFDAMIDRVKNAHAERMHRIELQERAARINEQMRREAQWRAEAEAMPVEQIVNEIERAGYAIEAREGKLLIPKNLPAIHRLRVELRRNEIIEYLIRRAEQRAAVEEV